MVEETARLAHAFIEAAPADALRRAIVISVEDAALHPGVALAAWLMVAHGKGLALSLDHKAALLELYADLARCAVHDVGDGDAAEDAGARRAVHWASVVLRGWHTDHAHARSHCG